MLLGRGRGIMRVLGAVCRRYHSTQPPNKLMESLYNRIKLTGPITVASYMKECLLHPTSGYYMKEKDVFGSRGDFTTSPEISQVFGELVGVWVMADWMVSREPQNWSLIELGPGRGTMLKDILRVFGQFRRISDSLSVHLVEASPAMSHVQETTLTGEEREVVSHGEERALFEESPYKTCMLESGVSVAWYQRLEDVPHAHSYIIAHEFFDALPVHQFQRIEEGWREVLVDVDPERDGALRFVIAPAATPASTAYSSLLPTLVGGQRSDSAWRQAEVCPEGLLVAKEIGRRVVKSGGAGLVVDYGCEGVDRHSLRGFKGHRLHDILIEPGTADMTADVDFGALSQACQGEGAGCAGPMTQNEFLHKMGIRQRLQALLKASPNEAEQLLSGYEMLTSPDKMGERFKFLTITSSPSHIPTPFVAGVEPFPVNTSPRTDPNS